ncbi:MAG: hypothetical protein ACR2PT_13125 [Endozoicomonas sp.]
MSKIEGSGPVQVPEIEVEAIQTEPVGKGNIKAVDVVPFLKRAKKILSTQKLTALRDFFIVKAIPTKTYLTEAKQNKEKHSTSGQPVKAGRKSASSEQEHALSPQKAIKHRPQSPDSHRGQKSGTAEKKPADLTVAHETEALVTAARGIIDHQLALLEADHDKEAAFHNLVMAYTPDEHGLGEDEASDLRLALSQACKESGIRDLSREPEYEVHFQRYVLNKLLQSRPDISSKPQEMKGPEVEQLSTSQAAVGTRGDTPPPQLHSSAPLRPVAATPLPRNIQRTLNRALKSKDPFYIIKKIPRYIEKAEKFALQDCKGAPSPEQQQALYQGLVQLGTHLLIQQNPVPDVPRSPEGKPNNKRRLGIEAEMLLQMRNASEKPRPELINTQAAVFAQGGLRTRDDKLRLLKTCFNLTPISVVAREKDIEEARKKRDKLQGKLLAAAHGSSEAKKLSAELEHQLSTIKGLEEEIHELHDGRQRGLKTNDDLFHACQAGLVAHLENRLAKNYRSYISKPLSSGAKDRLRAPEEIVHRIDDTLQKKANDYAKAHHGDKDSKSFEDRKQEALTGMRKGIIALLHEVVGANN